MKWRFSISWTCAVGFCLSLSVGAWGDTTEKPTWLVRSFWDFNDSLPNHFRTMRATMKSVDGSPAPATVGLSDLPLSASAEFSKTGLEKVVSAIGKHKITVVDLREEPHGYIDGKAVSWFSGHDDIDSGKTVPQINKEEKTRLAALSKGTETTTYQLENSTKEGEYRVGVKPEKTAVSNLQTEAELCKAEKVGYVRMPIPHDHGPSDPQVDQFIDLVKAQGKDGWLHIHCTDGRGRTTSLLAMYDMMRNANKVSLSDILTRQYRLGGADLLNASSDQAWKEADYVERKKFMDKFYDYCKDQIPTGFKQSWTSWLAKNKASG